MNTSGPTIYFLSWNRKAPFRDTQGCLFQIALSAIKIKEPFILTLNQLLKKFNHNIINKNWFQSFLIIFPWIEYFFICSYVPRTPSNNRASTTNNQQIILLLFLFTTTS